MKTIATLIAALALSATAFAQAPAVKKEEKKADAKPAVTTAAPAASAPVAAKDTPKSEAKAAPKKDDKKPADAAPAKK